MCLDFRLERVKSSSCDCPAKISLDSIDSCFTHYSSGSSSPKVAEFFLNFCFFFAISLQQLCPKDVSANEILLLMAFKDLYVSRVPKNLIVIPHAAHQALVTYFHVGFLRFTPPLCVYSCSPSTWDLQVSTDSQLRASTRKWGSWFRLGEVEPSIKEFLASPARMHFQILEVSCFSHTDKFPSLRIFLILPQ
jgi:hypothetical protein